MSVCVCHLSTCADALDSEILFLSEECVNLISGAVPACMHIYIHEVSIMGISCSCS